MKLAAFVLAFLTPFSLHTEYWWEPRWVEADCVRESAAQHRERPGGFLVTDPEFSRLHRRYFRLLTECRPE